MSSIRWATWREYIIPPVGKAADMDKWFDAMATEDRTLIKRYYKKYDINDLGKKDNREELLEYYPILETEPIYVLRDGATAAIKTKMEGVLRVWAIQWSITRRIRN